MERLQQIQVYIENMKIKKAIFGGYERNDVMAKMQEVTNLCQEYLEEENKKHKALIEEYEMNMQASQLLVNELNQKISDLSVEVQDMEIEKEQMKSVYKEHCSNILKQYSDSLRTLSNEFSNIMGNIAMLQQHLIEDDILDTMMLEYAEIQQDEDIDD